jgi:superfamily II RNA helicase
VELMDAVVQWCRGASFSDICKVRHSTASIHRLSSLPLRSSRTNSRAASFVFSDDLGSCSVKWPRQQRSLEIMN